MRKLKLQVQTSLDGYMAGINGEMDWVTFDWDEALKNYVGALTEPVDTIVLGRKLAEGFIPYWADVAANAQNPEQAAGKKFIDTPKVVFSKTLEESLWDNTTLSADLTSEIKTLKAVNGGDIIAYGGATFVSSLLEEGLVDELHLFINPVAIGAGKPVFKNTGAQQKFKLINATSFGCGIVVLQYKPKQV